MVKIRKILALTLALLMFATILSACGGGDKPSPNDNPPSDTEGNNTDTPAAKRYNTTRDIYLGQWWDSDYDSKTKELVEGETDPYVGQKRLDNIRKVEEKYNITFNYVNMTFEGAQESLNTSLKAGTPDVDIYTLDTQFMLAPLTSGYAYPISKFALDPNDDIYTNNDIFTPIDVAGMEEQYIFKPTPILDPNAVYMLGYNSDILQAAGQPDPQDLYDAGEWTWDKWMEIMKATTDTTAGTPTYGWSSLHVQFLSCMLVSNNAGIALTPEEGLTSPATGEVLEFINDMYNISMVAKPFQEDLMWENGQWNNGDLAFFLFVPWLVQKYGISGSEDCPYEIKCVPWPAGPTALKDGGIKYTVNLNGNVYMIPVGIQDPEIVYDVYRDFMHWWEGEIELRDDWTWMETLFGEDLRGWEYAKYCTTKPQYDMYNDLAMQDENGGGFYIGGIINGSQTPVQFAEQWKNIAQDYIDRAFGK